MSECSILDLNNALTVWTAMRNTVDHFFDNLIGWLLKDSSDSTHYVYPFSSALW
jgi:hypothetical protein